MLKRLPKRTRLRLAPEVYEGPRAFSVTISTNGRRKAFRNRKAVSLCLTVLEQTAAKEGMEVLVYCFMPDHLHLLLEAKEGASLIRFMKAFKQISAYRYGRMFGEPLWQKGYYEHVLRKEEDMLEVAEYIMQNPIRAGLVSSIEEYPSWGGTLVVGLRNPGGRPEGRPYIW